MNNPNFKKEIKITFLRLILSSLTVFVVHFFSVIFFIPEEKTAHFVYSIPELYLLFFGLSFLIMIVLQMVKKKNLDYVGYTFLIVTSVKMGIAYFLLRPVLQNTTTELSFEKLNFFIIFICFLIIETTLTIRILNNKQ